MAVCDTRLQLYALDEPFTLRDMFCAHRTAHREALTVGQLAKQIVKKGVSPQRSCMLGYLVGRPHKRPQSICYRASIALWLC